MDDDLTNIPDEFLPVVDDLPGELGHVARVIDRVVPGNGVRIVIELARIYRSTPVYFHNLDALSRRVRNQRIISRYSAGDRVDDIARSARLSSRQVWTILGQDDGLPVVEEKQLRLF